MKSSSLSMLLLGVLVGTGALAQAQNEVRMRGAQNSYSPVIIGPSSGLINRTPRLRTSVSGWALTGSKIDAYEVRCDSIFSECEIPILRTRAFSAEPFGMGSITHSESAMAYRGRRVEVRADVKAGGVDGWAGVWMRVDDSNGKVLAFDNMQNRPVRGTTAFQWYSVVLDVPADAARVTFGVLLHGPGAVFIREVVFESIGSSKSSTDLVGPLRAQSANGSIVDG